ncbi:MAG TPA: ATP-dependent DNA helicase [Alphaproteobacteria bacterium]|nr:ATP-dependent DNA helicase [Alphaproteobacteria bacterium]
MRPPRPSLLRLRADILSYTMTLPAASRRTAQPIAPVLIVRQTGALWLSAEGEIERIGPEQAARRVAAQPPILVHMPATARRLGRDPFAAFDLLELFAFVHPARFCLPTPHGLIDAVGLPAAADVEGEVLGLLKATGRLLAALADPARRPDPNIARIASTMTRAGWSWGPAVLAALGCGPDQLQSRDAGPGLEAWRALDEWSEHAPEPAPGHLRVEPAEARARLARLLGEGAEARPQQADYASAVTEAFMPREEKEAPRMVLAEAGTGVGKTLGYIAPASLWAERNGGAVWVSTFTRNLQQQIDRELDRLYPSRSVKALRAVVRKGRENYLCLLNFEEAVRELIGRREDAIALGLMARWLSQTRDGDMVGGDFPGWLVDLLGRGHTLGLSDRRGECVYSACPHYRKCFIEKSQRRARRAHIVIANHALVLVQAALGEERSQPTRLVFDEGHHLFEAADSAFSAHLTGREMEELRRWITGPEGSGGRRRRGLERRMEDLIAADEVSIAILHTALRAAQMLPGENWLERVADGRPRGVAETVLALIKRQVEARGDMRTRYDLETETHPAVPGLIEAGAALNEALARIAEPLIELMKRLQRRLEEEAATLDAQTRLRIEAMIRGLHRRAAIELGAWRAMLRSLAEGTPPEFVDWMGIERSGRRIFDLGLHRHWVDPTVPLARMVLEPAHGVLVTSATLTDAAADAAEGWGDAERRTGARHLSAPALRARIPSPFDYAAQTRTFLVTDVRREDVGAVAAAFHALFLAAHGGALGLFTAIERLKAVHGRIARPLEEAGLPLYAQHVDGLDTATLVDIFRAEEDACLLGTDAVRDGVDVPGRSLRLIVFDRVPWPRPDILYKARRAAYVAEGGRASDHDDGVARLRLRQAFGRLIRRADDRGVFVLLDRMTPSRLLSAFPEGAAPRRLGLAQAVAETRVFLGEARRSS